MLKFVMTNSEINQLKLGTVRLVVFVALFAGLAAAIAVFN
ncbi:hypothetical protein BH09ACT10_BH09ACT10_14170 [soil metagenome]